MYKQWEGYLQAENKTKQEQSSSGNGRQQQARSRDHGSTNVTYITPLAGHVGKGSMQKLDSGLDWTMDWTLDWTLDSL